MRHPVPPLARRTAIAAVLCTLALALVPTAFGDPWGSDHAGSVARQALDPAIRAAIAARSTVPITARSTVPAPVASTIPRLSLADDGFAWWKVVPNIGLLGYRSRNLRHDGLGRF